MHWLVIRLSLRLSVSLPVVFPWSCNILLLLFLHVPNLLILSLISIRETVELVELCIISANWLLSWFIKSPSVNIERLVVTCKLALVSLL